jgi:glutamate racemase
MNKEKPIGIFDSGIGGLTLAYAVKNRLPNENMIYFGDTAHLPYGDKSQAAIQAYSVKICDFLLKKDCKLILIACNSASAAAYELVKEYVRDKALVINVIDPVVEYVNHRFMNRKIGLIGTKQTVFSEVYQKKVEALNANISLQSLATPLLAPMIEEGFFENNISESIINNYLNDSKLDNIEALILGCTHYPLIKTEIEKFYSGKVKVIDSSTIVAEKLAKTLAENDLCNENKSTPLKSFLFRIIQNHLNSPLRFFSKKQ